ncbi:MAG TPA: hypothetical protein VJ484_03160 [Lysobacter sp.]|nr:hypothetical protein [Lysobacter sp.]
MGSNGVRHASNKASERQASIGLPWAQCGLIREHTIPVSIVCKRVREILSRLPAGEADATLRDVTSPIAPGLWSPRALHIADVVLKGTLMAWITEPEDQRLSAKGLGKCMPPARKTATIHSPDTSLAKSIGRKSDQHTTDGYRPEAGCCIGKRRRRRAANGRQSP